MVQEHHSDGSDTCRGVRRNSCVPLNTPEIIRIIQNCWNVTLTRWKCKIACRGATEAQESHGHIGHIKSCAECSKQCNNDCRNAPKCQFTPKQANKLKLPNLPVGMETRCIGDMEGSKIVVEVFHRHMDVKTTQMTEQNRQMQQIRPRMQNSLGVHKIETLKYRGQWRHVNTYFLVGLGMLAIA